MSEKDKVEALLKGLTANELASLGALLGASRPTTEPQAPRRYGNEPYAYRVIWRKFDTVVVIGECNEMDKALEYAKSNPIQPWYYCETHPRGIGWNTEIPFVCVLTHNEYCDWLKGDE